MRDRIIARAGEIVAQRMGAGNRGFCTLALIDEEGYPAASMITASKADGFKWIAFCTGVGWNKPNRAKKDPRACVYLFDKASYSGISLVGKIEVITDYDLNKQLWYDALGDFFKDPADERLCVLMFKPERYNIFIEGKTKIRMSGNSLYGFGIYITCRQQSQICVSEDVRRGIMKVDCLSNSFPCSCKFRLRHGSFSADDKSFPSVFQERT